MKRKKSQKRKVWPIILVVLTVLIVMAAAAVFLFAQGHIKWKEILITERERSQHGLRMIRFGKFSVCSV